MNQFWSGGTLEELNTYLCDLSTSAEEFVESTRENYIDLQLKIEANAATIAQGPASFFTNSVKLNSLFPLEHFEVKFEASKIQYVWCRPLTTDGIKVSIFGIMWKITLYEGWAKWIERSRANINQAG